MAQLSRKYSPEDPELEKYRVESAGHYEVLAKFTDKFINEEFNHGPFVIHHNDLDIENVLVDEDFNITGILDFPGTIVPLPTLCVNPWMFHGNYYGPIVDRDEYLNTFVNRECNYQTSLLQSSEIRQNLMKSSWRRQRFDSSILGVYTALFLPSLLEDIYGYEYDEDIEFSGLTNTYLWFKKLLESKKASLDQPD